jgi:O-antigen ligase
VLAGGINSQKTLATTPRRPEDFFPTVAMGMPRSPCGAGRTADENERDWESGRPLLRHRQLFLLLTGAWVAAGVILYLCVPLISPALLLLCPVAPIAWYVASERGLPRSRPSTVTFALLLAGTYLACNTSWSLSPASAHLAIAMFFLAVLATHLTTSTLAHNDADVLRAMAIGLYAGIVIGGVVLLIETVSQQWIRRTLMSLIPGLRPKSRDMIVDADWVVFLESYLLNRNIAGASFLFWPTLFLVPFLARSAPRRHWWLAGLIPAAAAILTAKHTTSKIAFVGAVMTFAAFQVWPRLTRRLIAWAWVGIIFLVVPLATLAYHNQLYVWSWIPHSAKHRIVIWGYTSKQIANAPILGSGIDTARAINEREGSSAPFAPGSPFRLTTNLHSHNIYLQAWYDAGAVGAGLLLFIGLLVVRALAKAPQRAQPYLYTAFVTCALLGGASFGLWQPWFMASFGLVTVFAMLGWALVDRTELPDHRRSSDIPNVAMRTSACGKDRQQQINTW